MTKVQARTQYLQKRMELPEMERQALTLGILEAFQTIPFRALTCVHVYRPIVSRGEIETQPFIRHLEALFPGLILVVPRVTGGGSLEHVAWNADTLFAPNPWGIPEPMEGEMIRPEQVDMVLTPLVIFDKRGDRVGYGKGMYDRFLSLCRPDALKIGLSFFEPIEALEDRDEFDVPLDIGVTPTKLYEFV